MGPVRWRRHWTSELAAVAAVFFAGRSASAAEAGVTPSESGRLGAWLALGPLLVNNKPKAPARTLQTSVLASGDESQVVGALGRSLPVLASASDEGADLAATDASGSP